MAIADDISVATNGDIRWTGATATYTVLEFHRFLQDLADDAVASGDDLLDITSDTPSDRSTDNIISLLGTYNIDDEVSEHLYDGSISQADGDTVYSGLVVVGSVEDGTELQIIQDNKLLNSFWGAAPNGINAVSAANIIAQVMIKTRGGGADIDAKRLRVQARELGDAYAEFSLTAGLGNSTAAVFTSSDLNNATPEATIAGFTSVVNTEGYQALDIDGDGSNEFYYAQWDKGTQTLNDTYERTKWVQARNAVSTDSEAAGSATDYIVDNATILGQGQSFTSANDGYNEILMRCTFNLQVGLGSPTGEVVAELYDHSGTYGTSSVATGGALATSIAVPVSKITGSYATFNFEFQDGYELTANTNYVIVVRHADGDGSNYLQVEGTSDDVHGGNRTEDTGSWAASSGTDLRFEVYTSPVVHTSVAGELFRGITHQVPFDGQGTSFQEDEVVYWGTSITYDGLAGGTFAVGNYVTFTANGETEVKNGGKILADNGTNTMVVALEDTSGNLLNDDVIAEVESGTATTAAINGTPATGTPAGQDQSGGEGFVLAMNDLGATGTIWIQLLSGSAPVNDLTLTGRTSGGDGAVNGSVTSRTVSPEFLGASTGSNLIGAYGIGFDTNDVGASDQFFDLTNSLVVPPNNVTFTVTGLIGLEDRVLVAPRTGSLLDYTQLELGIQLTGNAETVVTLTGNVPTDTPTTGQIRLQSNSGIYNRVGYTAFATGSPSGTFTITSTDFTSDNSTIGNNVFVGYIDDITASGTTTQSYTAVYSSDRSLFVRVRDGGSTPIKTFESPATFGNANSSIAAIRTSDA